MPKEINKTKEEIVTQNETVVVESKSIDEQKTDSKDRDGRNVVLPILAIMTSLVLFAAIFCIVRFMSNDYQMNRRFNSCDSGFCDRQAGHHMQIRRYFIRTTR